MVSREEQAHIEGELAHKLRAAPAHDRQGLYGEVYDEIYGMHLGRDPSQLEFGADPAMANFLERHTSPGQQLLEIGCGAGLLAIELARRGRRVTAVDVSKVILERATQRAAGVTGVQFVWTPDMKIPAPDGSIDFAYSVEVLEHLHEDDVHRHLQEVHRVLRPGGLYWLITPNRLDSVGSAERFGLDIEVSGDVHLKEWTYGELIPALERADFVRIRSPWRNTRFLWMPLLPARVFAAAELLPRRVMQVRLVPILLGLVACAILAEKPHGRP